MSASVARRTSTIGFSSLVDRAYRTRWASTSRRARAGRAVANVADTQPHHDAEDEMRSMDGMRIIEAGDGPWHDGRVVRTRELIAASETGDRWRFGEVVAERDGDVTTHHHPGEPEALIILEGPVELHGAAGVTVLQPGRSEAPTSEL